MKKMTRVLWLITISVVIFFTGAAPAQEKGNYISYQPVDGGFSISNGGKSTPVLVSSNDFPGVIRVAKQLQADIEKVTGSSPQLFMDKPGGTGEIIIAGTLGKSPLIDALAKDKKIDASALKGKWEKFIITTVENPMPDVARALVIAGSDKRGTIYGLYDISENIGVSPWYWWADVPVKKHDALFVNKGSYTDGEPKVKYRGIFINDEAPALSGWSQEKYGTVQFNHKLYEHVFELILRLKGNFLWPAMWGRAFYDDDPENPRLADEYGVVISTSHHEPLMRAHVEWQRYGSGPWDYSKNEKKLREFWAEGIKRMGNYESVVTLAMRGDGDEAMSPDANVGLLEKIVKDQREIIKNVTGKDIESIPQVWALYKEVQEYYDKGMRVPDDVTVLLCDDNWGNIRKLPKAGEKPRSGGYGIYYHFDYVGGPRNYKWLNTNQIERVWEQMNLAYRYGADRIWVVNVGDIKPMEFPIDFFLDFAWNPEAITADKLPAYYKDWAAEQFGDKYSAETAGILADYTKFNSRRKPELLSPETYSLTNYREAERVVEEYKALEEKARRIYKEMPAEYKDAYYQLVLHPVEACANLNELYAAAAKNKLYEEQGRSATNFYADKVKELFDRDAQITDYYNNKLAGGKWSHMMDQTHIGYTNWQEPPQNNMPGVETLSPGDEAEMGVAIEGSSAWWPDESSDAVLPEFDNYNKQSYYLEIFNRGNAPFDYSIKPAEPWIMIDKPSGKIEKESRLWVSIDWEKAPVGSNKVPLTIEGAGKSVNVYVTVLNNRLDIKGFAESNGYISMEAEHYSNAVNGSSGNNTAWVVIPNLGRTSSGVTGTPVTAAATLPGENSARLEYKVNLKNSGDVTVNVYVSPTLNFQAGPGLKYAVSLDNGEPQVVNIHESDTVGDWKYPPVWNNSVANNIRIQSVKFSVDKPGEHLLKIWMIDPAVVFQKIIIDTGNLKASYLGAPESYNSEVKTSIGELK